MTGTGSIRPLDRGLMQKYVTALVWVTFSRAYFAVAEFDRLI
jgi:hypothetical protein